MTDFLLIRLQRFAVRTLVIQSWTLSSTQGIARQLMPIRRLRADRPFDSDAIFDYRAQRPIVSYADGRGPDTPGRLSLVTDVQGEFPVPHWPRAGFPLA